MAPALDRSFHTKLRRKGKNRLTRIALAGIITLFLIFAFMSCVKLSMPEVKIPDDNAPMRISTYVPHDPISISGNAGFLDSNTSTGISNGSGTADDPYVIEGWEINASGALSAI